MNTKIKSLFMLLVVTVLLGVQSAFAVDVPPLDLTATGVTVAGYIAAAALAGVAILGAMYGIRVIIRAFKAVK